MCKNTLLLESDFVVRSVLAKKLEKKDFNIEQLSDITETFDYNIKGFDLIILSVPKYELEIVKITKELRKRNPIVGIVIMFGSASIDEQVILYEVGADVVASKPIDIDLLVARIQSTNRRVEFNTNKRTLGDVGFDVTKQMIECNDVQLKLNPTEAKLMLLLADSYGKRVVSNDEITKLLYKIEGYNVKGAKVYIYRIRNKLKKLKTERLAIKNHYGNGYYLSINDEVGLEVR